MVRGTSRFACCGSLLLHGAAVFGVCCLAGQMPARRELARVQIREQIASPPPAPPQPPPEVAAELPPVQAEEVADELLPFDVESPTADAPTPAPPPARRRPSLERVVLPERALMPPPEHVVPPPPPSAPPPPPNGRVEAEPVTGNQPPPYPPTSRARREQGEVLLAVDVDERGHVRAVTVVRSSGFARLDRAAQAAVEQWRFTPARQDGVAATSRTEVVVEFRLAAGT